MPRAIVSADVILSRLAEVKVDHLSEDGGFGTADADSGASRGSTGIKASGQEHSSDRARAWIVARDGATVFTQVRSAAVRPTCAHKPIHDHGQPLAGRCAVATATSETAATSRAHRVHFFPSENV